MKISDLKINGIKQPIGYYLERPYVSWTVKEITSQFSKENSVEVSKNQDFTDILCKVSGKDVDSACTILPLELEARTRYYVRVFVKGNMGEEASAVTFFETGKMQEGWNAKWIGTKKEDKFHPIFSKSFLSEESTAYNATFVI